MSAKHSTRRPQPVLTRAGIVTVIGVLAALLVNVGAGNVSVWLQQNSDWIAGAILAVATPVAAWLAKSKVTPLSAPQDNDGNPLVPDPGVIETAAVDAETDAALAAADAIRPADPAAVDAIPPADSAADEVPAPTPSNPAVAPS